MSESIIKLEQVHRHPLSYVNATEIYATKLGTKEWVCNTCNRLSRYLKGKKSYHCTECSFDVCLDCAVPLKSPKHQHPLKVVNILSVKDNDMWTCYGCGVNGRHEGQYAWRCESCGFDLCYGCTKDYKSFMHEHILTKSDPKKTFPALISWKCQLCKKHYSHTDVEKPYICRECKPPFRICGTCLTAFLDTEITDGTVADMIDEKKNGNPRCSTSTEPRPMTATYRIVNGQRIENQKGNLPGSTSTKTRPLPPAPNKVTRERAEKENEIPTGLISAETLCNKRKTPAEFIKSTDVQRRSMSADARAGDNAARIKMETRIETQRRASSADATRTTRIKVDGGRKAKCRPASTNDAALPGAKSGEAKFQIYRESRERRRAVSGVEALNKGTRVDCRGESRGRQTIESTVLNESKTNEVTIKSQPTARIADDTDGSVTTISAAVDQFKEPKNENQSDARARRRAAIAKGLILTEAPPVNNNKVKPSEFEVKSSGVSSERQLVASDESTTTKVGENDIKINVHDKTILRDSELRFNKPVAFISYQWGSQDKVLKLREYLEVNKIPCWIDIRNMGGGDELKTEIDKGIRAAKLMISCVTEAYTESKTCQQEVALADALRKPIVPVLMEPLPWPPAGSMAMPFAPLIYVDCTEKKCGDYKKVLESIKLRV